MGMIQITSYTAAAPSTIIADEAVKYANAYLKKNPEKWIIEFYVDKSEFSEGKSIYANVAYHHRFNSPGIYGESSPEEEANKRWENTFDMLFSIVSDNMAAVAASIAHVQKLEQEISSYPGPAGCAT